VIQRRSRTSLVAKARPEVRIATVLRPEELDRDEAIELVVVGAIDPGHAALPEELHEPIAAAEDRPDLRQAGSSGGLRVSRIRRPLGWECSGDAPVGIVTYDVRATRS